MMSTVMAAVIVTTIVVGAIVTSMVIIRSVPRITVAAIVIAGSAIPWCTAESDTEVLGLRLVCGHSQQSQKR